MPDAMAGKNHQKEKLKRVTVADLAVMVGKGFAHADEQLKELRSEMNERFEQVGGRFSQIEDRFQSVEMKILGVGSRIDMLIDRTPSREEFSRLEGRVATLETRRRR